MVCITNISLKNIPEEDETTPEDNTDLSADNHVEIMKNIKNFSNFLQGKVWVSLPTEISNKLTSLAGKLGQTINRQTFEDSQQVSGEYKNFSYLNNIDAHYWLSKRNSVLISFLENLTGVSINDKRTKKLNAFSQLIEQVLYTRNLNIVTPFSFKRNLVMYSVTNSKTAVKLQSSWESSGSYTTVHDILASKVDPISCPIGDIHNTIDNNQKVGICAWRIC